MLYGHDSSGNNENQGRTNNILRITDGLYLNQVQYDNGYKTISKDVQYLHNSILNVSVARKNDSTYQAICNTPNYLYSLLIYWDRVELVDSIAVDRFSCLPDSIKTSSLIDRLFNSFIYLSHDATTLIFNEQSTAYFSESTGGIFSSTKFGAGCSIVKSYQLDPYTGKFLTTHILDGAYLTYKESVGITNTSFIFSPNSRIVYGLKSSDSFNYLYNRYQIWQYNLDEINPTLVKRLIYDYQIPKSQGDTAMSFIGLPKLGPSGNYIFCLLQTIKYPMLIKNIITNVVNNPNTVTPNCNLLTNTQQISLKSAGNPSYLSFLHKHVYDFVKITHKITANSNCKVDIDFLNKSDTSGGLNGFKYIIELDNSLFDTIVGFQPTYSLSQNGKYPYKVIGTGKYGYTEIYEDTLNVTQILKPKITNVIYPRTVCRYQVFNISSNILANDNNINKYSWVYSIEGSDPLYVKNITHAFIDTGLYSIQLVFSNSFCSDTFLGIPIRVVDAPQPGFKIDKLLGCAPLIIKISDTITRNVVSKEYWYSDTSSWVPVSITQKEFTHRLSKKGNYKIVQRLTGITGCVTQEDTIEIFVSSGLTDYDTINVINATVSNPAFTDTILFSLLENRPILWWNKLEGAVMYKVLKDGIEYGYTRDTIFKDLKSYTTSSKFEVEGIDSCGTSSSIGRMGIPIFMKAKMLGNNESALLEFSPYRQWYGTNLNYIIEKFVKKSWVPISNDRTPKNTLDKNFLVDHQLFSCYRIRAFEISNPNIITYSNIVCIPYIPTVFVPTAFSPNGDGVNDVYDITSFGITDYSLTILNRWGEILEKTQNSPWSGNYFPEGVYTILITYRTYDGKTLTQRATVTLFR